MSQPKSDALRVALENIKRVADERTAYWRVGLCEDIAREFEYIANEAKFALEWKDA